MFAVKLSTRVIKVAGTLEEKLRCSRNRKYVIVKLKFLKVVIVENIVQLHSFVIDKFIDEIKF